MNGCSELSSVDIISNPIVVTSIINEVSCGGDGAIDITVTGQSPYSYEWKEELIVFGIPFGFQTFTTSEDVSSLNAQTVLVVTDNNGCIYTDTFNLGVYEIHVNSISTNIMFFRYKWKYRYFC